MIPPVRLGLIGCGAMGRGVHLPLLTRMRDVTIVALAEPDPAARMAPGAMACASHEELIARAHLDAVLIATPTPTHAEIACLAFRQGRHVYLEKPLAATLGEAAPMLADWRAAGTVGMIGFNYRFNPLYAAAKRSLDAGALGTVSIVRSVFATPAHPDAASWRLAGQRGAGALLDLASHHLDLFHFLFGQCVTHIGRLDAGRGADAVCVSGRLEGGAVFQSLFATGTVDEDRLDIYGDRGMISIDRYRSLDVGTRAPHRRGRLSEVARVRQYGSRVRYLFEKLQSPRREPSHARALRHFADAVRGRHPASPDLLDGCRSLEAVVAAASPEAAERQLRVPEGRPPAREAQSS